MVIPFGPEPNDGVFELHFLSTKYYVTLIILIKHTVYKIEIVRQNVWYIGEYIMYFAFM